MVYDKLGRLTSDTVASLGRGGENVDDAVRRIERDYATRGELTTITSYDATTAGNVVNEVVMTHNGFGQTRKRGRVSK